jgi:hypothetical protein
MLCLKKRRTYSFSQGARKESRPRRSASSTRRDVERDVERDEERDGADLEPGFLATLPRNNT